MTLVKVKDSTYVRDMHSKAILETDTRKRDEYKARSAAMNQMRQQAETVKKLEEEMSEIKRDFKEILSFIGRPKVE